MHKLTSYLLISVSLILPLQAQKRRVAVLNFDYATVQSDIRAIFGGNQDVGKGVADLLVNKLVTDGVYSVIERKALDKLLAEQNFSNSDRADAATAAKIGKMLGVDAIIIGSITQFGRDDKTQNLGAMGGSVLGGIKDKYGLGGVGKRSAKAVVGLSARLVNTDTGEILAVASGKGESRRTGTTLLGAGAAGGSGGAAGYDMSSQNFSDTILGEAVSAAVTQLGTQLDQSAQRFPERAKQAIDGLIADASGGSVVLNIGSKAGLRVGDRLKVMRVGRAITDPASGRVLRRVEEEVGEVQITDVDEASAGGTYTGSSPAKVGDRVKQ